MSAGIPIVIAPSHPSDKRATANVVGCDPAV